ncbi:MAG: hypothetical protein PVH31_03850 [Ectothiorhodospiraceae bacterium]|jgi:hypothetical protein
MVAVYVAVIWGFFAYIWPLLPPWVAMIFFIALAVFAIGSPIFWLARWSDRLTPPSDTAGGSSGKS